ncbi:MAG TPA: hypothetical protein EYP73_02050 [Acidimicrobiia bacterium]|nr:hypothetical protein [Acidimicrobiia bacterium]
MSRAARTIYVWSIYALVVGAVLAVIPNVILGALGVAETQEVWIRVLGVVVIILALYYWDGAKNEARHLFVASLLGRGFAVAAFILLWLTGGPWQLLIFAAAEVVGTAWTYSALRE